MATATAALQRVRTSSLIDLIGLALLALLLALAPLQVLRGPDQVHQHLDHRVDERCDLRPRRSRLHARLRDPPAHQLRPRRCLRALGSHREHADHLGVRSRHRDRGLPRHRRTARDAGRHDARFRPLQREHRAHRLQAVAKRPAAGAADHGRGRLVHRPEHLARALRRRLRVGARTSSRGRTRSGSATSQSSGTTSRSSSSSSPCS